MVSGSIDNSAILWNISQGKGTQRFEGHRKFVQGVSFDPRMKFIVTVSPDKTARMYKNKKSKKGLEFFTLKVAIYWGINNL